MRRAAHLVLVVCALCPAACGGSNHDRPDLFIELLWDEDPDDDFFVEGSCRTAGVRSIEWVLVNSDGDEVEGEAADCDSELFISALEPDEYSLIIVGFDDEGVELWNTECVGLSLRRFDAAYSCDVPSVPPPDDAMADAGT